MAWVVMSAGAAFAGLAVLAFCGFKVFVAVRGLGHELERARRRLAPRHAALRDELDDLQDSRESQNPRDGVRSS